MNFKGLQIAMEEKPEYIYFDLNGDIRTDIYSDLNEFFNQYLNERHILMNCSALKYMSSTGVGVFFTMNKKLQQIGKKLILIGLNKNVKNVITLTKLLNTFIICETKEEAIQHLN